MPRIRVDIRRDLGKQIRKDAEGFRRALERGTKAAGRGLKDEARAEARTAGLGNGVANAWRQKDYPDPKRITAMVYTKAPNIIRSFNEAVLIRGVNKMMLAIPTPAAPKRGTDGKRISPSNFPTHRFGELQFVRRPGKPPLLVAGRLRAARLSTTKAGPIKPRLTGRVSVPMFVLLRTVQMPRLLRSKTLLKRWGDRVPELVAEYYQTDRAKRTGGGTP